MTTPEQKNAAWKNSHPRDWNDVGLVLGVLGYHLTPATDGFAPDTSFTVAIRAFQGAYANDVRNHPDWNPRSLTVDGVIGDSTFAALRNYYAYARRTFPSIGTGTGSTGGQHTSGGGGSTSGGSTGGGNTGGGGSGGGGSGGGGTGGGNTGNTGNTGGGSGGGGSGGGGSGGGNTGNTGGGSGGGGNTGNTGTGMATTNNQPPSFIEQIFPPENSIVQSLGGPTGAAIVTAAAAVVIVAYVGKQMSKPSHPARTTIIPPAPTTVAVAKAANPRRKKGRR